MSSSADATPSQPTLRRGDGGVRIVDLGSGAKRFTPAWLDAVSGCIDAVAQDERATSLVTTASGKVWAVGLDLDWMVGHPDQIDSLVARMHELCARLLELPVVSVAAIQGHAIAGGAMLAIAHDLRVMRADRGYLCLPEADMGIAFTPGLARLLRSRLPSTTCRAAMLLARRYGGDEALAAGLVDEVAPEASVLAAALALAERDGGKPRETLVAIRRVLDGEVVAALRDRAANRAQAPDFPSVL